MKNYWLLLQAALIQFTRIPVKNDQLAGEHFHHTINLLPAIGLIIGGISSGIFWITHQLFPSDVAVLFAMATSILLTGALHEDGFADCCDAFGASGSHEKMIAIMKDSRLGTYGTLGILFLLLSKFTLFSNIEEEMIVFAFFISHFGSRLIPAMVVKSTPHYSSEASKMSSDLTVHNTPVLLQGTAFLLLTYLLFNLEILLLSLISLALISHISGRFFRKKLGGYTGDCLGAAQQVGEIGLLLVFALY
jgi:adenosylcobinamide-GDP ribazoletransferase